MAGIALGKSFMRVCLKYRFKTKEVGKVRFVQAQYSMYKCSH